MKTKERRGRMRAALAEFMASRSAQKMDGGGLAKGWGKDGATWGSDFRDHVGQEAAAGGVIGGIAGGAAGAKYAGSRGLRGLSRAGKAGKIAAIGAGVGAAGLGAASIPAAAGYATLRERARQAESGKSRLRRALEHSAAGGGLAAAIASRGRSLRGVGRAAAAGATAGGAVGTLRGPKQD